MKRPSWLKKKTKKREHRDRQTGKSYVLETEVLGDVIAATFSVLYLIAMLLVLCWQLLDMSIGQNLLLKLLFPQDADYLESPLFQLLAYTVIGGGLGGVMQGIRSFIVWHLEERAFGWRFLWKYLTLPLVGAVLAGVVYAIIRGGVGVLEGGFAASENFVTQAFSAFAIGALVGYGSHQVFMWLDHQVNKLFGIAKRGVPNLKGKTREEAEAILKAVDLELGKVDGDPTKVGKVIVQNPSAGSMTTRGESVDVTIAKMNDTGSQSRTAEDEC